MALLTRKDVWHEKFQIMSWIFEQVYLEKQEVESLRFQSEKYL